MKRKKLKKLVAILILTIITILIVSYMVKGKISTENVNSNIEQSQLPDLSKAEVMEQWTVNNITATLYVYQGQRIIVISGTGMLTADIFNNDICRYEIFHQVEINEGITGIESYAFSNIESINRLILAPSIINVTEESFRNCYIVHVVYGYGEEGLNEKNRKLYTILNAICDETWYNYNQQIQMFRHEIKQRNPGYEIYSESTSKYRDDSYNYATIDFSLKNSHTNEIISETFTFRPDIGTIRIIEEDIKPPEVAGYSTEGGNNWNYYPEVGWSTDDIKIIVNATDNYALSDKAFSFDGGETWQASNIKEFDTDIGKTNIIIWVKDLSGNISRKLDDNVLTIGIDRTKPIISNIIQTASTIRIIATDATSGINGYAITENNTKPTGNAFTKVTTTNNLDIAHQGLQQNKTYYIWVRDQAGNISDSKEIKTLQIPALEKNKNVSIVQTPENWTNGNVTLTVETSESYNLQVSTDGQNWTSTNAKKYTNNYSSNMTLYARLYDGNSYGGQINHTITNIDKTLPIITIGETTTNEMKISATDSQSRIIEYAIETGNTPITWKNVRNNGQAIENMQVTEIELKQNTLYRIWVKDLAGNIAGPIEKTTLTVPAADGNVTFSTNPSEYTRGNVIATIEKNTGVNGYTLETSKDNINWTTEKSIEYSENGTIYARLKDDKGQVGRVGRYNITNIDKTKPVVKEETTATTNSITIVAKDEQSKIVGYIISTESEMPTEFTEVEEVVDLNTTINNLKQNTKYYIWAKDKVGNISECKEISTLKVPDLIKDVNVTFTPNITELTTENITVNISTTENKYTLQISKDRNNWEEKNQQLYTDNGTIYARIVDSTGQFGEYASYDITNIERTPPTIQDVVKSSTNWTNTRVTLIIKAIDDRPGLAEQAYSFDNGTTWQKSNTKIYSEHQEGIIVKVRDGLGNTATYSPINIDNIDIDSPVIDKIEKNKIDEMSTEIVIKAYDTQSGLAEKAYSFDGGRTWQESNKKIVANTAKIEILVRDKVYNVASKKLNLSDSGEEEPPKDKPITSDKYEIGENTIENIPSQEDIKTVKDNIKFNDTDEIKVYNPDGTEAKDDDKVKTGTTIVINGEKEYQLIVLGDVNGDGEVDLKDMLAINKHILNKVHLEGIYLKAANVNKDEVVDIKDILQINKYRLGKIEKL